MIDKFINYLKDVKSELNKVAWLTSENLKKYTLIVIAGGVLMGIILGGFDFLFMQIKLLIQ